MNSPGFEADFIACQLAAELIPSKKYKLFIYTLLHIKWGGGILFHVRCLIFNTRTMTYMQPQQPVVRQYFKSTMEASGLILFVP